MTVSLIALAILLAIIFLGMPVAIATALVGVIGFAYLKGLDIISLSAWLEFNWKAPLNVLAGRFFETAKDTNLAILPLFIFMGNMISRVGMARDLYDTSNAFLAHRRGGLASATVMACGGFASVCGSSLATVATMGKVSLPAMRDKGYQDSISAGCIAAGGTLGILIPPSSMLIIYGILTETSIRELFVAGFIPGIIGLIGYLLAVQYVAWRKPEQCPAGEYTPWLMRFKKLKNIIPVMILFIIVLGGIYLGVITPEESAGIGAVGSVVIALIYRRFTVTIFKEVLADSVRTSAAIFCIVIGALTLSTFVTRAGLPAELLELVTAFDVAPYAVIFIILAIYIVLGMFFDSFAMLLLTVPIFYPLVAGLGFDLVWFGIIVIIVTEISMITPPIGINVFVLNTVMPDLKVATIFKGVTPFWVADMIRLVLLTLLPSISLVMPYLLYRA